MCRKRLRFFGRPSTTFKPVVPFLSPYLFEYQPKLFKYGFKPIEKMPFYQTSLLKEE